MFPEDTGAQITRGKRTTKTNKREGNAVKLWYLLFSFEALISRLCEWTVLVHSFYGKCSLNVNKLYLLLLENILYGKSQINWKFAFSLFVLCSLITPAWIFPGTSPGSVLLCKHKHRFDLTPLIVAWNCAHLWSLCQIEIWLHWNPLIIHGFLIRDYSH